MFQATNQMGMGQDLDLFLEKRGCTLFLKQKKHKHRSIFHHFFNPGTLGTPGENLWDNSKRLMVHSGARLLILSRYLTGLTSSDLTS